MNREGTALPIHISATPLRETVPIIGTTHWHKRMVLFQIVCLVGTEIIACVWGLVVCHILVCYCQTVWDVLHEAVYTIVCGYGGNIESEFATVFGTHKHFLSPVAYDIGTETRIRLGPVVERASLKAIKRVASACSPVILAYSFMVEHLPK